MPAFFYILDTCYPPESASEYLLEYLSIYQTANSLTDFKHATSCSLKITQPLLLSSPPQLSSDNLSHQGRIQDLSLGGGQNFFLCPLIRILKQHPSSPLKTYFCRQGRISQCSQQWALKISDVDPDPQSWFNPDPGRIQVHKISKFSKHLLIFESKKKLLIFKSLCT